MKKWLAFLCAFFLASAAYGQTAALQGYCDQGGKHAITSGLNSSNYLQGDVPHCTITIYLTGTSTKATLYSDIGGTPLANPFTANALTGLLPGKWLAWAAINQGYDVVGSGGDAPNTYPAPVTLCSDCYPGSSFSGAPTVIQVNGTPTSPVSPVNFVDSGTVTFQRTGATISATAAGGGACPGSVLATAVLSTNGTNCVGDSYFTYSDFTVDINRFGFLKVEQGSDIEVYAVTDPLNNNWQFTGDHLNLISNGANSLGGMFLNVNDGSFTGTGTSGPLPLLINAQTTRVGHNLGGIEVTHTVGGIAVRDVTGYEYDAPGLGNAGDSALAVTGFLAAMEARPSSVTNNDLAFWATTPVGQTIASNYCDFYASANTGAAVRGSLFCGPDYASTFNGPVTVGGAGSQIDFTEQAAPANPSSGKDRVYTDIATHQLSCLTSAGASCMPAGGTPGGSNTQMQFNNSGSFGGSNLTWDGTTLGMATGKQFFGNGTHDVGTIYDYEFTNAGTTLAGGTFENAQEITYRPNFTADVSTTASTTAFLANTNATSSHQLGKLVGFGGGTNMLGSGNFNEARGMDSSAAMIGNGSGNGLFGTDTSVGNFGTGTIAWAAGATIQSGVNAGAGSITLLDGLYVGAQLAGVTNHNIFSAGATTHNVFEGDLTVNGVVDSSLTPGTSPICPNGTGGAFTTSGCAGGGSGTVTSVAQTVPSWLAVGGSPVTTTGTLAITAATGQTSHQVLGTCGTATSFAPCSLTVADLPALPLYLNWTFNTGAAATDAAPRLLASHASSISTCYVLTTASDGATALTLNIFDNGTSVFSGGAQTVAAGTAAGTLTTLGSLTSTPLSIANNDKLSINITSGTSSWIFTVQCK